MNEFKNAVYGENHDQEEYESIETKKSATDTLKKRKNNAVSENLLHQYSAFEWEDLAENGKVSWDNFSSLFEIRRKLIIVIINSCF